MDENQQATLQTLVEYYRNKCNKLEHDFVLYQAQAETIVRQLKAQVEELSNGSTTSETNESVSEEQE
jgi:exonuclease V gamma subunit